MEQEGKMINLRLLRVSRENVVSHRIFIIVACWLSICSFSVSAPAASPAEEITVSAAISLKNAFEDLGNLYEATHGTKVIFNFGASGALAQQIEGGAPVDVFAAAAQKDMDRVDDKRLLVPGSRANFAGNDVVLVIPLAGTTLKGIDDLKMASVKKIAIGNPRTVPAGRYAAEVLDYYQLSGIVSAKLVFTENARQTLDYVARGEVDAAIVYATDAAARAGEVRLVASAPEGSHQPVVYPMALVKGTRSGEEAKAFITLVISRKGQAILEKYGFKAIKEGR
jgi:molybdate transport system substrate-binding protein